MVDDMSDVVALLQRVGVLVAVAVMFVAANNDASARQVEGGVLTT